MRTGGGDTALHWVCSPEEGILAGDYEIDHASGSLHERSLRVTELLLGAGADVVAKNERDLTPLDVASGDGARVLLLSAVQALQRQQEEEVKARSHQSLAPSAPLFLKYLPQEPSYIGTKYVEVFNHG